MARIGLDGTVRVTSFDGTPWRASTTTYGKIQLPPIVPSPFLATGFVEGLAGPVIFKEDVLLFKSGGPAQPFETSDLHSQVKGENGRFPDFEGGVFRLTTWRQGPGIQTTQKFMDFRYDTASAKFVPVSATAASVAFSSRFAPVYADTSELFAFTERDEIDRQDDGGAGISLYVASRGSTSTDRVLESTAQQNADAHPVSGKTDAPFIPWSIAFLPNADTLTYRDAVGRFNFIEGVSDKDRRRTSSFAIASSVPSQALAPLRPQWPFGRPALAAARVQDGYRVAWLTENGMAVFRSLSSGQMVPLQDRSTLLTSLRPVDSFTHLRFRTGGDMLLVTQQVGSKVLVRIWDISDSRNKSIESMKQDALLNEACDVASADPQGNKLSDSEADQLPDSWKKQPCS